HPERRGTRGIHHRSASGESPDLYWNGNESPEIPRDSRPAGSCSADADRGSRSDLLVDSTLAIVQLRRESETSDFRLFQLLSTSYSQFHVRFRGIQMSEVFDLTSRPDSNLFFNRNDPNDPRLGEIVGREEKDYAAADIVILGCPQDEGVRRNNGREGAAKAPDAIRTQFYRLTPMNIRRRLFDLGNVDVSGSLEEVHDRLTGVVKQVLKDGKRLIILGGGNDISYADGRAMAEVFGPEWWIGVNIDSHLDVRIAEQRNSGTPYRQLLEEKL